MEPAIEVLPETKNGKNHQNDNHRTYDIDDIIHNYLHLFAAQKSGWRRLRVARDVTSCIGWSVASSGSRMCFWLGGVCSLAH